MQLFCEGSGIKADQGRTGELQKRFELQQTVEKVTALVSEKQALMVIVLHYIQEHNFLY